MAEQEHNERWNSGTVTVRVRLLTHIASLEHSEGEEATLELLSIFASGAAPYRAAALDALWAKGNQTALVAARAGITDASWVVRDTAYEALGELGGQTDVWRIRAGLQDKEWVVRASAISALGSVGKTRALENLVGALKTDRSPVVRRYAAIALADHVGKAAVPALLAAENQEKSAEVRVAILEALALLGFLDRAPRLEEMLSADSPDLTELVIGALIDVRAKHVSVRLSQETLTLLRAMAIGPQSKRLGQLIDKLLTS